MNERLFDLLISSFGEIFIQGIKVTIPLTIISFLLAMIIALITAIVQVANIKKSYQNMFAQNESPKMAQK